MLLITVDREGFLYHEFVPEGQTLSQLFYEDFHGHILEFVAGKGYCG